ncbi:MAG: alkaline phosphatase family protein [Candidatus Obscuribacterales bacterium]|nr:alkaline phosphatase family protein [Candidatus Obscuribacterales bacterium]
MTSSGVASAQAGLSSQPKLVVLIMVDQLSFDYFARYQDKFGSGGFRLLQDNGANFLNCRYEQATTLTAVGHSIVSSGAYPWASGIVGNTWYDRRKEKEVDAVADESMQLVGSNGAGSSCKSLLGTTIGDELKLATNGRSKIISCSLKGRSALLMAGRTADGAYWWDDNTGNFVTSSQFGQLGGWAKTFNDRHYADGYFGRTWQRLLSESSYSASTNDDYTYESMLKGDGRQFPHVLTGGGAAPGPQYYSTFAATPFANQMLADFVSEAVTNEGLGRHNDTDLLAVSFSSTDLVGHAFGPDSQEAEDTILRLDQTLAGLFKNLDTQVGLGRCLIVLTADHGVMPIPELLKERGMDAGRIDTKSFKSMLDAALDQKLGNEEWISSFQPPNLYLNLNAIDKQKYRQPDVEALAAKLCRSIPGVGEVYTAFQFFMNQLPSGPQVEAAKKSYFWGRSGELYVMPKPGYIFSSSATGTTHGSPYRYDSQVPLFLMGPMVRVGRFADHSSPADVAPTLAALLNITAPSQSEGRVLSECLAPVTGPNRPLSYPTR